MSPLQYNVYFQPPFDNDAGAVWAWIVITSISSWSFVRNSDIKMRARLIRDVQVRRERQYAAEQWSAHAFICSNTVDFIAVHSTEHGGRYGYVSPACTLVTGFMPADLSGRSPLEFVHPEDLSVVGAGFGLTQADVDGFFNSSGGSSGNIFPGAGIISLSNGSVSSGNNVSNGGGLKLIGDGSARNGNGSGGGTSGSAGGRFLDSRQQLYPSSERERKTVAGAAPESQITEVGTAVERSSGEDVSWHGGKANGSGSGGGGSVSKARRPTRHPAHLVPPGKNDGSAGTSTNSSHNSSWKAANANNNTCLNGTVKHEAAPGSQQAAESSIANNSEGTNTGLPLGGEKRRSSGNVCVLSQQQQKEHSIAQPKLARVASDGGSAGSFGSLLAPSQSWRSQQPLPSQLRHQSPMVERSFRDDFDADCESGTRTAPPSPPGPYPTNPIPLFLPGSQSLPPLRALTQPPPVDATAGASDHFHGAAVSCGECGETAIDGDGHTPTVMHRTTTSSNSRSSTSSSPSGRRLHGVLPLRRPPMTSKFAGSSADEYTPLPNAISLVLPAPQLTTALSAVLEMKVPSFKGAFDGQSGSLSRSGSTLTAVPGVSRVAPSEASIIAGPNHPHHHVLDVASPSHTGKEQAGLPGGDGVLATAASSASTAKLRHRGRARSRSKNDHRHHNARRRHRHQHRHHGTGGPDDDNRGSRGSSCSSSSHSSGSTDSSASAFGRERTQRRNSTRSSHNDAGEQHPQQNSRNTSASVASSKVSSRASRASAAVVGSVSSASNALGAGEVAAVSPTSRHSGRRHSRSSRGHHHHSNSSPRGRRSTRGSSGGGSSRSRHSRSRGTASTTHNNNNTSSTNAITESSSQKRARTSTGQSSASSNSNNNAPPGKAKVYYQHGRYVFEYRFKTASGHYRWLQSSRSVTTEGHLVCVTRDISAVRQKFEVERKYRKAEQEKRAVAENAIRDKRAFLSYVFHEVRVPLNAITLGIDVMAMDAVESPNLLCEDHKDILDTMAHSARMAMRVLSDSLQMNAVESGRFELHLKPMRVAAVVLSEMRKALMPARATGHVITVPTASDLDPRLHLMVYGDQQRLVQVFGNFVSNALKHAKTRIRAITEVLYDGHDEAEAVKATRADYAAYAASSLVNTAEQQNAANDDGGSGAGCPSVASSAGQQNRSSAPSPPPEGLLGSASAVKSSSSNSGSGSQVPSFSAAASPSESSSASPSTASDSVASAPGSLAVGLSQFAASSHPSNNVNQRNGNVSNSSNVASSSSPPFYAGVPLPASSSSSPLPPSCQLPLLLAGSNTTSPAHLPAPPPASSASSLRNTSTASQGENVARFGPASASLGPSDSNSTTSSSVVATAAGPGAVSSASGAAAPTTLPETSAADTDPYQYYPGDSVYGNAGQPSPATSASSSATLPQPLKSPTAVVGDAGSAPLPITRSPGGTSGGGAANPLDGGAAAASAAAPKSKHSKRPSSKQPSPPTRYLRIRLGIEDDGAGISHEDQAKLFRPYQQVSSGAMKENSTGLGLAISREIVRSHGGTVGVISGGVGRGSLFYVDIPFKVAKDQSPPAEYLLAPQQPQQPTPLHKPQPESASAFASQQQPHAQLHQLPTVSTLAAYDHLPAADHHQYHHHRETVVISVNTVDPTAIAVDAASGQNLPTSAAAVTLPSSSSASSPASVASSLGGRFTSTVAPSPLSSVSAPSSSAASPRVQPPPVQHQQQEANAHAGPSPAAVVGDGTVFWAASPPGSATAASSSAAAAALTAVGHGQVVGTEAGAAASAGDVAIDFGTNAPSATAADNDEDGETLAVTGSSRVGQHKLTDRLHAQSNTSSRPPLNEHQQHQHQQLQHVDSRASLFSGSVRDSWTVYRESTATDITSGAGGAGTGSGSVAVTPSVTDGQVYHYQLQQYGSDGNLAAASNSAASAIAIPVARVPPAAPAPHATVMSVGSATNPISPSSSFASVSALHSLASASSTPSSPASSSSAAAAVVPQNHQNVFLRGHRALIVDDSDSNRRMVQRVLQRLGANCTPAENGAHAIKLWIHGAFDMWLRAMQQQQQEEEAGRAPAAEGANSSNSHNSGGLISAAVAVPAAPEGVHSFLTSLLAHHPSSLDGIIAVATSDPASNASPLETAPPHAAPLAASALNYLLSTPALCPFDFCCMDNTMPVMDGRQATRRLRALGLVDTTKLPLASPSAAAVVIASVGVNGSKGAAIGSTTGGASLSRDQHRAHHLAPIIIITGNAALEDERALMGAGANLVLAKPIDVGKLKEALLTLCNRPLPAEDTLTA